MKALATYIASFAAAVLVAAALASLFSTQFVLAGLGDIGVEVPLAERLTMTARDLAILRVLLPAFGACFLVGFLVAGLLAAWLPGSRAGWFVAAGAASVVVELLLISSALGLMPVAGARTVPGLLAQGVAGGVGGWSFARLTRRGGGARR